MHNFRSFLYSTVAVVLLGVNEINGDTGIAEHTNLCLYTSLSRRNCSKIVVGDISTIKCSGFNANKTTKLIVPGWFDPLYNEKNNVRDAYLSAQDVNVITFDWLYYTFNARQVVVPIAKYLAKFIDWLVTDNGVIIGSIHVIGFSLGGQLAGVIGEYVTLGKIGRITGLDPVGLTFNSSSTAGRLDSSDGAFVDVIHSCGGVIGYTGSCGHVDFYPNDGKFNQPGCPIFDFGVCSHLRAFKLFAESIASTAHLGNSFVAQSCGTWLDFQSGNCNNSAAVDMGEYVDKSARGNYFLNTASESPFALG